MRWRDLVLGGWVAWVAGAAACGGGGGLRVVDVRDVPAASGAPSVRRVVDLGDVGVPAVGALPPGDGDGVFVVGELVLVEGDDFGKQPTLNIGGRPAEILARTGDGGIVTRVPAGVASGQIEVEVSHVDGRSARAIEVRRWAVIADRGGGAVHAVALGPDGAAADAAHPRLALPGAWAVGVSPDGVTALVAVDRGAGQGGSVAVVSLVAAGGPKVTRSMRYDDRPRLVAVAALAPLAAVVGAESMMLVDLDDPRAPAPHEPVALGDAAGKVVAAVLDPGGTTLALLIGGENRLVLIDVSDPFRPGAPRSVALLPDERMPLVVDVEVTPAGDALWVLAGETAESRVAGAHPTEVVVVDPVAGSAGAPMEIAGAGAPTAMAVARREEIQGATAIRSTRRTQGFVLATGDLAALEANAPDAGALARSNLEGEAQPLWSGPAAIADVALAHDGGFAAAAMAIARPEPGAARLDLALVTVPLAGGEPRQVRLGDPPTAPASGAPAFAVIALSP